MNHQKLIDHLNDLASTRHNLLESLVGCESIDLERRIAAILCVVASSSLPIATATTNLIIALTAPDLPVPADATATPFGLAVTRLLSYPRDATEEEAIIVTHARKMIAMAQDRDAIPDESTDHILRHTTGKDAMWWLEWIRERLGE